MDSVQPHQRLVSAPTFGAWFTQWRLSILEIDSAPDILAAILDSMNTEIIAQDMHQRLAQFFFAPGDLVALLDPALISVNRPSLFDRAVSLDAPRAKRLLEYLGRSYPLDGSADAFWEIASQALEKHDSCDEVVPPNMRMNPLV